MAKAITTRFHGPTNCRGSRITASDEDGNRMTVSYDHALNSMENHREAAVQLVFKMNWHPTVLVEGGIKGGYVFVMLDGGNPYAVRQNRDGAFVGVDVKPWVATR